jgi:hypothetical protein
VTVKSRARKDEGPQTRNKDNQRLPIKWRGYFYWFADELKQIRTDFANVRIAIVFTNEYLPCRKHRFANCEVVALIRVIGKIRIVIIVVLAMRLVCVGAETMAVMVMMLGLRRQPM